ncbi:hypothetical protein ACVDG5_018555 [Mesorhizobium sp. ORM6]
MKAFREDAASQQQMILAIDRKGQDIDTVVNAWIDQHQAVWQPWVQEATR